MLDYVSEDDSMGYGQQQQSYVSHHEGWPSSQHEYHHHHHGNHQSGMHIMHSSAGYANSSHIPKHKMKFNENHVAYQNGFQHHGKNKYHNVHGHSRPGHGLGHGYAEDHGYGYGQGQGHGHGYGYGQGQGHGYGQDHIQSHGHGHGHGHGSGYGQDMHTTSYSPSNTFYNKAPVQKSPPRYVISAPNYSRAVTFNYHKADAEYENYSKPQYAPSKMKMWPMGGSDHHHSDSDESDDDSPHSNWQSKGLP